MRYYTFKNSLFDDKNFSYGEQRKENFNTGKAAICPECKNFISSLEWLPPFELDVSKKKIGDFIFGSYIGFIVSQRVKCGFEKSNMKSLSLFNKVDLYFKGQLLQEDYFYPRIPLIKAFIDLKQIELENINLCNTCQKGGSIIIKVNGISFLNTNKITEDVFFTTSLGQATIIVSENFKSFIEVNSFTNADLIEISKYKWDSMNPMSN